MKTPPCPCGGPSLARCCGPYLRGEAHPETAVALMRSRYTAYVRRNIDYLVSTHAPPGGAVDPEAIRAWAQRARWQGLTILATRAGGALDAEGEVTFEARYSADGKPGVLRERSRFARRDGRWVYVDGVTG